VKDLLRQLDIQIKEKVGVCEYLIPYELPKRGTSHIHHVAVFYLVQNIGGSLTRTPENFEGQDSLGALWVPLKEITADNSSPLVLQAIYMAQNGEITIWISAIG
jgi:ADP-ribose pyrophosphatase YjhB (NUDIX family)